MVTFDVLIIFSFSSRYEARAHVSLEEAEAMAYRIAELEVLLEEQRK